MYTSQDIDTFKQIKALRSQHIPMEDIGPRLQVITDQPGKLEDSTLALIPSIASQLDTANATSRAALARIDELTAQLARVTTDQASQAAQLASLQEWLRLPWWKRLFTQPPG